MTPLRPRLPNFAFCSLVPMVIYMHAKVEVSSLNRFRDMEGCQNFKFKISNLRPPLTQFRILFVCAHGYL